jgi:N-acetylmuramoyl-L-alanine amidase
MSFKVVLNPGHCYPPDPGAVGYGLSEAERTQTLVALIAPQLPSYGIECVIVHSNELSEICTLANSSGADLFLSLHINAGGGTGYEDYVFSEGGQADTYRGLLRIDVMNYLRQYGFSDRGQKYNSSFYVLKNTSMPAILTENLFIDTEYDAARLGDASFMRGLANAYAKGIARALGCCLIPPGSAAQTKLAEAVAILQEAGVISSPEYWLESAKAGKAVNGEYAGVLIQKMAEKLS